MMTSKGNCNGNGTRRGTNGRRIIYTQTHRFPPRRISFRLVCATLGIHLLIILCAPNSPFSHPILVVDAFANNLVNTGIGCMTELSTDEVIMNNEVKPPEESDFPKFRLAVLDGNENPLEETTFQYDPSIKTLQIAFLNPYTTKEFNEDLQFVVEIEGPTEDSRAAEFVTGGASESIGCENNKRVSGRLLANQAAVVLQVNDPSAKLRIWGGWATGHSAVRLLPDLLLEPKEEGESLEELEEELLEEEFQNTDKEKLKREKEEAKLEKLLHDEADETAAEESPDKEESLEELEEELLEEEFQNTDKEKLKREKEEAKLEKLLHEDSDNDKDNDAKKEKPKLKRMRKNLLNKADNIPEGLIDPNKKVKDLGLEIKRKDKERGQQQQIKTIQEKLKDKQFDLNSQKNAPSRKKKQHKLSHHTAEHRQRRDIPETVDIYDDRTDDDLPQVEPLEATNDDSLPDEGDLDDAEIYGKNPETRDSRGLEGKSDRGFESNNHVAGCAFFLASAWLFTMIFGKKKEKGRRDL